MDWGVDERVGQVGRRQGWHKYDRSDVGDGSRSRDVLRGIGGMLSKKSKHGKPLRKTRGKPCERSCRSRHVISSRWKFVTRMSSCFFPETMLTHSLILPNHFGAILRLTISHSLLLCPDNLIHTPPSGMSSSVPPTKMKAFAQNENVGSKNLPRLSAKCLPAGEDRFCQRGSRTTPRAK